jgi:hypothetical protein
MILRNGLRQQLRPHCLRPCPAPDVTVPVPSRHQLDVKLLTAGKLAAGVAGTAGAGSIGALVEVLVRITALHAVPAAAWVMLAALIVVSAFVASLALIMGYRLMKLEVESAVDMEKARQEMYRALLEKSSVLAASSADHRELINADTQHLLAERNGAQLDSRPQRHVCGPGSQEVVQ